MSFDILIGKLAIDADKAVLIVTPLMKTIQIIAFIYFTVAK